MSCIWITKLDVVLNGVIKQENSLENSREVLEQSVNLIVTYIASTKRNLACIHIPEAFNQTDKRCLARTTWTYNGTRSTCRNRETHIVKNLPVVVAKRDMRKLYVARIRFLQTFSLFHCRSGENSVCLLHCNFNVTQNS